MHSRTVLVSGDKVCAAIRGVPCRGTSQPARIIDANIATFTAYWHCYRFVR